MPKCLLVIDPVPTNRIRLSAAFESAHYDVVTAATPEEAARLAYCDPDLVILGIQSDQPRQVIRSFRTQSFSADIPLLCIDADASPMRRLQALRAGARDVLPRSLPDRLLLGRLRGLIREGDAELECQRRRVAASSFGFAEAPSEFSRTARIAVVNNSDRLPQLPEVLRATLGHRIDRLGLDDAMRGDDSLPSLDAYVIVAGQDGATLETLLPELRDRSHSRHASVLVLHPAEHPKLAVRALNLGASDITADNATGEELAIRIDAMLERKRMRDRLRKTDEQSYRLAATDPLTGLYNRRYAEAYLADLMMREQEHERGFVMMVVDLDHFKVVNDRYGHSAGDRVLCEVANRIRDNLRACDLISRHGGEEFLAVLPDTGVIEAERTAERLRQSIAGMPIPLENGVQVSITASIGVAFGQDIETEAVSARTGTFDIEEASNLPPLRQVFDAADAALYRAKVKGRNRVEFSAAAGV
ncbi:MAG: diguanylate cyclase [Silicimonas sp.]|nr:diguanylate cyclase [Silicimonas sp.]